VICTCWLDSLASQSRSLLIYFISSTANNLHDRCDSSVGERINLTVCLPCSPGSQPWGVFQGIFSWLITLCQPVLSQRIRKWLNPSPQWHHKTCGNRGGRPKSNHRQTAAAERKNRCIHRVKRISGSFIWIWAPEHGFFGLTSFYSWLFLQRHVFPVCDHTLSPPDQKTPYPRSLGFHTYSSGDLLVPVEEIKMFKEWNCSLNTWIMRNNI